MVLLGYDIGSSFIKATLLDAETGTVLASAASPETELDIVAARPGWAEQDPELWWKHLKIATADIMATADVDVKDVQAIGISYQMHGLVCLGKDHRIVRPAIIWCDSRAVPYGQQAFARIGQQQCLERCLNSPGNFTAAKLKWVKENEPEVYAQIHKIALPGDYIAMKLTGEIQTTPSGLSEGILWDFQNHDLADIVLDALEIDRSLIPQVVPTFSVQGQVSRTAADELGLRPGIKVAYRAGDQPNNALSLNVLQPGELAATAGTSGVVYGVGDKPEYDKGSRVNTFVHVNHERRAPRYGVLLCVNGCGILNSWLKHTLATTVEFDYDEMNTIAAKAPVGCEGLTILPFGNGAERTLDNRDLGASVHGLMFNTHGRAHLLRAAQEGVAFALNYGVEIMREMGLAVRTVRAGDANFFKSPLFAEAFATVTGATVEIFTTDGSQGAARGAGIGAGVYHNSADAFLSLAQVKTVEPNAKLKPAYEHAYGMWRDQLLRRLARAEA